MEFPGLRAAEFENYGEPRSRSNVYSRARLEVKERLLAAGMRLAEQMRGDGYEIDVLASDHHPSLWNRKIVDRQLVFFSRGAEERASLERLVDRERSLASTLGDPTPYFKHVFLCLCASSRGFEVAVKLHWNAWVDRTNLLSRLGEEGERQVLLEMLASLPEEYVFGVEGGPVHPVTAVDGPRLEEILERFRDLAGMLSAGLVIDPVKAENLGPDLIEVASAAFTLLAPVYDFFSWSEEVDFISLRDREQALDEERRAISEVRRRDREEYEARRRERKAEQALRSEQERAEKIDQQMSRRARRVPRPAPRAAEEPVPERPPVPAPAPAEPPPPPPPRRERRRRESPEAGPLEVTRGIRVEISTGVLEGKWGIVQEVDRHGQAKVVLGSLVARIPVAGLRLPKRR